jgi:polyhydroxyalkanoate synthase subunit PhaC
VGFLDRAHDASQREAFFALEEWAGDNIAFPAAAYVTYIRELYQQNLLCKGEHYVAGKRVDLGKITSPVLSVVATHDTICPPAAASALVELSGAKEKDVLTVQGGHVGAVVGHRARHELYPKMVVWLNKHLALKSAARSQLSA